MAIHYSYQIYDDTRTRPPANQAHTRFTGIARWKRLAYVTGMAQYLKNSHTSLPVKCVW